MPDGTYSGAPLTTTVIAPSDVLIIYCRRPAIAELDQRPQGPAGDGAHAAAVKAHEPPA